MPDTKSLAEAMILEFIGYIWEEVRKYSIYVLGGQGQAVADILPKIPDMENGTNLRKILEKIKVNIYHHPEFSMTTSRAFDCSGLGTEFFLGHELIEYDMTADAIYNICDDIPVKATTLKLGDMVFQEGYKKVQVKKKDGTIVTETVAYKHHVGYVAEVVDGKCTKIIEAKGRAYGVVASDFKTSNWSHAGRPSFWGNSPEVYVLKRELYFTDPMMQGEDVKKVQEKLNVLGFNCGNADSIFGRKTEIAVKNFQTDRNLDVQNKGTIGKKTATALGFGWEVS